MAKHVGISFNFSLFLYRTVSYIPAALPLFTRSMYPHFRSNVLYPLAGSVRVLVAMKAACAAAGRRGSVQRVWVYPCRLPASAISSVHSCTDGKAMMEFFRCPYSAPLPLITHPRTGAAYLKTIKKKKYHD